MHCRTAAKLFFCLLLIWLPTRIAGQDYVLLQGPLQQIGLPVSTRDLSLYVYGVYIHAEERVEVYLTESDALAVIRQRTSGLWAEMVCDGRELSRAVRYGKVFSVPVDFPDILFSFSLSYENPCRFIRLFLDETEGIRNQPGYESDPFPALLPMPR